MDYAVEMLNISKQFPGILANDNVTLQVEKNSIHALLGENGAGKSTLMSILFGLYQPTSGVIKVHGKEVKITDPNIANDLGIGMVHQHFKLIDCYTVTENIILGREPKTKLGTIDMKAAEKKVKELSELYGLNVDPKAQIDTISVGMQQRVEILKMLYRDAEILIFDEPTAVLTPQEIDELMQIMRNLIKEGKTILLITHKLKEIKAVADRCTVLRRGKGIGTIEVKETSTEEMAAMMVGRNVEFKVEKTKSKPQEVVLEIEKLWAKDNAGLDAVKDFSLQVRKGEIVGLAGIDGNGQTELIATLSGLQKAQSGSIKLNGKDILNTSIKERSEMGMAEIPEDRHKHGLVLDFPLKENMIIHCYDKEPFSKFGILNSKEIDSYSERLIEQFDVRCGEGKDTFTRGMSGGNQQKAIIAREIDRSCDLLIAVQPTRGLDVGAIEYTHKRIVEERDKGHAILLVSLDLDEILALSDRVAVIHGGELTGLVNVEDTDENELGLMMSGAKTRIEEVINEKE